MRFLDELEKRDLRLVYCHRIPERSFFFQGKQFPVCARCTGVVAGMLTFPVFHLEIIHPTLLLTLLLAQPLIIDGLTQALSRWESNNTLRFVTGIMFGVAQAACIVIIGKTVAYTFIGGGLIYLQSHVI